MDCKGIEEKLSAYIEGDLPVDEKSKIAEHLPSCARCSSILNELNKTVDCLGALDKIDSPPWFEQKIMQRIREEHGKQGLWRTFFYPLHVKIPVQALAAGLIIVLAVQVFRNRRTGNEKRNRASPRL